MDTLSDLGIDSSWTNMKTFNFMFNKDNVPKHCIAMLPRHWVAVRDGAVWDSYKVHSRGTRPRKLKGYVMFNKDNLCDPKSFRCIMLQPPQGAFFCVSVPACV